MRDPCKELEEIANQLWWQLDQVIKYSDTQFLKEYLPPIIQAFEDLDIDFAALMYVGLTEGVIKASFYAAHCKD